MSYEEVQEKKLAIARLAASGDKRAIEALRRFISLRESGKLESWLSRKHGLTSNVLDDIYLGMYALVKLGDVAAARRAALSWYSRDPSSIQVGRRAVSSGPVPKEGLLREFLKEVDSEVFCREVLKLLSESLGTDDQLLETLIEQINPPQCPFPPSSWHSSRGELEAKIRIEYLMKYANREKVVTLIERRIASLMEYYSLKQAIKQDLSRQMSELSPSLSDLETIYYESSATRVWNIQEYDRLKEQREDEETRIKALEEYIGRLLKALKYLEVSEERILSISEGIPHSVWNTNL